ncbi:nucleotidyltransferase domain-containing protein [Streptomyces sp. AJS327]|uniref:nucleotidyltransferase domain-containing protein n=1 Tax=Streptomyces sp. AJS327 TaxID=2545265 RepID=UPI0015DE13D0|nr:nucleotidyltransferase domain-containing protein [Streptomyces sp. AJS327]MBA0052304.1 nucleotidyltransferase domain-containing protein [Streptomyces sp. AJS327]
MREAVPDPRGRSEEGPWGRSGRSPRGSGEEGAVARDGGADADGEEGFLDRLADRLAGLPTVRAVALGGSRARGEHRVDSDWDVGVYYRGEFDPEDLRALGLPGEVCEVGAWGGGVFNGGAWLTVEGRRVDVHYRDLDVVEREVSEAGHGRFHWEPLMFHLAGIPSYLVVAELARARVLRGELPRPEYPAALRASAPSFWRGTAELTLSYARANHVPRAGMTEVAGALATAAAQIGHAVLAARGEWVTNEKRLLGAAGLRAVDGIVAGLRADPATLEGALAEAEALFAAVLAEVPGEQPPADTPG